MVVRMRLNRSKTGKRRSHHKAVASTVSQCECGALRMPHRACASCGKYRGKIVIDVVARAKKAATRMKRKEKELRAAGESTEKRNVETK